MKLSDFEGTTPALDLVEYFEGETRAWGMFTDRSGAIKRQFVVDITGTWNEAEETLTLEEDFVYDDGETEKRVWVIRRTGPDTWVGTADGVVGEARGRIVGQALNWEYDFDLPWNDGTIRLHFDDWMLLQGDGVLLNHANVSKFGIKVGQVSLFFRQIDPAIEQQSARPAMNEAAE